MKIVWGAHIYPSLSFSHIYRTMVHLPKQTVNTHTVLTWYSIVLGCLMNSFCFILPDLVSSAGFHTFHLVVLVLACDSFFDLNHLSFWYFLSILAGYFKSTPWLDLSAISVRWRSFFGHKYHKWCALLSPLYQEMVMSICLIAGDVNFDHLVNLGSVLHFPLW